MSGFPILAISAILLLLVLLYWRHKKTWVMVYNGTELTEQASDQFALLQNHNIRCRIRNVPLRNHQNTGFASDGSSGNYGVQTIIEIHKADMKKAKQLLERHVSGQYELNL